MKLEGLLLCSQEPNIKTVSSGTRIQYTLPEYTGLSKKMDGIWNRYNLKSTGRIYTFGVLKCSEKFEVLGLPQYICKLIIVKLNLI